MTLNLKKKASIISYEHLPPVEIYMQKKIQPIFFVNQLHKKDILTKID